MPFQQIGRLDLVEYRANRLDRHRFPLEGFEEAMRVIKSGEAGKVIFEIL